MTGSDICFRRDTSGGPRLESGGCPAVKNEEFRAEQFTSEEAR